MPLQHDYRPQTFDEFFGNADTIDRVQKMLQRPSDKIPKAFLIVGHAGCGKTTLAYLIRDAFGCSIEDFTEIDGSKERGITHMRSMSDSLDYTPMIGGAEGKQVVLLDEVHGITPTSQEAILKTLEDPPKNTMLILCTTEPSSLKDTIKRRCTRVDLKPVITSEMIALIDWVLESEEFDPKEYPLSVKKKIMRISNGSPGVALNILDSIIDVDNKSEDELLEMIEEMTYGEAATIEISRTLINYDNMGSDQQWEAVRKILSKNQGHAESLRIAVLGYMNVVMLDPKNKDILSKVMTIADFFTDNFFSMGDAGLSMACYHAIYTE